MLPVPVQQADHYLLRDLRTGTAIPIGDYLVLGAEAALPHRLEASGIADRHLRIERRPEGYVIKDLRSPTGTFVNNTRVAEAYLRAGDEVQLGEALLVVEDTAAVTSGELSSRNQEWQKQLSRMRPIAISDTPVLLLGPSGSGKEVMAQAIHRASTRYEGPFVSVNCSALTETLVESELFGHVKGSFTGAVSDRKGAFESARGGTLFLDEIGDLPYGLQAKLLRALENSEIRPVGSDRIVQTNVRIIAATHQNLSEKIEAGEFRLDLYYRLAVSSLTAPALKERMEDFEEILMSFARKMRVRFSFTAIQKLKQHSWPGNIRELKNTVARAAAYFPKQGILEENIPAILDPMTAKPLIAAPGPASSAPPVIREIERDIIVRRLSANGGNQRKTAADLRMPKSTLHDRLRLYAIDPKLFLKTRTVTV